LSENINEFKSTKQVLELIGLTQDEIEAYFHLTGRGPVMTGEIALLINISEEKAVDVAKNLLEKGLVREIPGTNPFYIALPPYSALLNQIQNFKEIVSTLLSMWALIKSSRDAMSFTGFVFLPFLIFFLIFLDFLTVGGYFKVF